MEKYFDEINNILSDCNNQINENIVGLNYLEKLKYLLIEKIRDLDLSDLNNIEKNEVNDKKIKTIKKFKQNNLEISIEYYQDSISKIKHILEKDILSIVVRGFKSIDIFDSLDNKSYGSFALMPQKGAVLSQGTLVSEKLSKDSIVLDIINKNENTNIEK